MARKQTFLYHFSQQVAGFAKNSDVASVTPNGICRKSLLHSVCFPFRLFSRLFPAILGPRQKNRRKTGEKTDFPTLSPFFQRFQRFSGCISGQRAIKSSSRP